MQIKSRKGIKENSGVLFHPEVEIDFSPRKNGGAFSYIGEIVMIFLSIITITGCFLSGIEEEINTTLVLGIGVVTLLQYVKHYYKKLLRYTVPAGFLFYIFVGYTYFNEIKEGFCLVANSYIELFDSYYNVRNGELVLQGLERELCITMFLLFLLTLLTGVITSTFRICSGRLLYALLTAPFVFVPAIVGKLPNSYFFVGYVIMFIGVWGGLSANPNYKFRRIMTRTTFIMIGIGVFLFGVGYLCIPPTKYNEKVQVQKAKETIQTNLERMSKGTLVQDTFLGDWAPFRSVIATGGLSGGKLGNVKEVIFENKTVLKIKVAKIQESRTYLRGYIGSTYQGDSWGQLSRKDKKKYNVLKQDFLQKKIYIENLNGWFIRMGGPSIPMTIENVNGEKDSYLVPYASRDAISIDKSGMLELEGANPNSYEVQYVPYLDQLYEVLLYKFINEKYSIFLNANSEEFTTFEKRYREFVYDVYTKLPQKGSKATRVLEKEEDVEGIDFVTAEIKKVKEYLAGNTSYSLSPGILPKGEDFVDYFLFENKKGYCAHYASAATLLFRSLGIPARYVEGYIINYRDVGNRGGPGLLNINIKDSNAHAWVELYLDGYGWIPVETTPGYTDFSELPDEILNQVENGPKTNELPMEQEKSTISPSTTSTPINNQQEVKKNIKNQKGLSENEIKRIKILVFLFGSFLFILGGFFIRDKMILRRRIKSLQSPSSNYKVIYLYHEISKVLAYYGLSYQEEHQHEYAIKVEEKFGFIEKESFETFFEIVLKASFSQQQISEKELGAAMTFYAMFRHQVYENLPKNDRIYLKYILVF